MAERVFPAAAVILAGLALLANGCAAPAPVRIVETVEVRVPVPVRVAPPAELAAPFAPEALPAFVAPADPAATSALTPAGERRLRLLLLDLVARLDAWRAWAAPPTE